MEGGGGVEECSAAPSPLPLFLEEGGSAPLNGAHGCRVKESRLLFLQIT